MQAPWRWLLRSPSLLICLVGCLLYLPWLNTPFGVNESNAGCYLGVVIKNYHQLGFWETLGAPLGYVSLEMPKQGVINMHHPPGWYWLYYPFGTAVWQIRAVTAVVNVLLGIVVYRLLRLPLGDKVAITGSLLVLVAPALSYYCRGASPQQSLMLPGLAMLALLDRVRRQGQMSGLQGAGLALLAFIGTWMDWGFIFMCLAATPWPGGEVWRLRCGAWRCPDLPPCFPWPCSCIGGIRS